MFKNCCAGLRKGSVENSDQNAPEKAPADKPESKLQKEQENKENNDLDDQQLPTTLENRQGKYYVWIGTTRFGSAPQGELKVKVNPKDKGPPKTTSGEPTMSMENRAARWDEDLGHFQVHSNKDSDQIFTVTLSVGGKVLGENDFNISKRPEVSAFWLSLYPPSDDGQKSTPNSAVIELSFSQNANEHHSPDPWNPDEFKARFSVQHGHGAEEGTLDPGRTLHKEESIYSDDMVYRLMMQTDGNCVLNGRDQSGHYTIFQWATFTNPYGYMLVMQLDGNLVLYTDNGIPLWWTGTNRNPPPNPSYFLSCQNDSNLVIYQMQGQTPVAQWSRWWW